MLRYTLPGNGTRPQTTDPPSKEDLYRGVMEYRRVGAAVYEDMIKEGLTSVDIPEGYYPLEAGGRGNCLFCSLLVAIGQPPRLHPQLRRAVVGYFPNSCAVMEYVLDTSEEAMREEVAKCIADLYEVGVWADVTCALSFSLLFDIRVIIHTPTGTNATTVLGDSNWDAIHLLLSGGHFRPIVPGRLLRNRVAKLDEAQVVQPKTGRTSLDSQDSGTLSGIGAMKLGEPSSIQPTVSCANLDSQASSTALEMKLMDTAPTSTGNVHPDNCSPRSPIMRRTPRNLLSELREQLRGETLEALRKGMLTQNLVDLSHFVFSGWSNLLSCAQAHDHNFTVSAKRLVRQVTEMGEREGMVFDKPSQVENVWQFVPSRTRQKQRLLSDAQREAKKIICWRIPSSYSTLDISREASEVGIPTSRWCAVRRKGYGTSERVEIILQTEEDRRDMLLKLEDALPAWKPRAGRAYAIRKQGRSREGFATTIPHSENPYQILLSQQQDISGQTTKDYVVPTTRNRKPRKHFGHPAKRLVSSNVDTLNIACWNSEGKIKRAESGLSLFLKRRKTHILAVTETWLRHSSGPVVTGYTWIGRNRDLGRQKGQRGSGGVGLLIADWLVGRITYLQEPSFEGSLWVKIQTKPRDLFLGVVYGLQEGATRSQVKDMFSELGELTERYSEQGEVILVGDFNARVGNTAHSVGPNGEERVSSNGKVMLEFLQQADLRVVNGFFPRKEDSTPNWTRERGESKSIIDYIAVKDYLLQKTTKWEVVSLPPTISSDHRLISASFPFEGTRNLAKAKKRVYQRWRVETLENPDNVAKYREFVKDAFEGFLQTTEEDDEVVCTCPDVWTEFQQRLHTACVKGIGVKMVQKGSNHLWWSAELKALHRQRQRAYREAKKSLVWEPYFAANERYSLEVEKARKVTVCSLLDEMAKFTATSGGEVGNEFWAKFAKVWNGNRTDIQTLQDTNGNLVSTDESLVECARNFYERLYNSPLTVEAMPGNSHKVTVEQEIVSLETLSQGRNSVIDAGITSAEVEEALARTRNTAAGNDRIKATMLKAGGEPLAKALAMLFRVVIKSEVWPWKEGIITLIHKEGDPTNLKNYRPITLTSVVAKLLERIVLDRINRSVFTGKNQLAEEQAGFRKGRDTMSQVLTLTEVITRRKGQKKPFVGVFIDFEKAYDSIWREGLWKKAWEIGIQGKAWRMLRAMYEGSQSSVLVNGLPSGSFSLLQGLKQGSVLSPLLFNIFINDIIDCIKVPKTGGTERGVEVGANLKVSCLLYADDLVILMEDEEEMQTCLNDLQEYCNKWRLKVNIGKSAAMRFAHSKTSPGRKTPLGLRFGETQLNHVESYKYLGVDIDSEGGWDTTVNRLSQKVAFRLQKMDSKLFKEGLWNLRVRKQLFECLVRPAWLYGAEAMDLDVRQKGKTDTWQYSAGRRILRTDPKVNGQQMRCNVRLHRVVIDGELGWKPFSMDADLRKLLYWGRIQSMDETRLVKQVTNLPVVGCVGRKRVWAEKLEKLIITYEMTSLKDEFLSMETKRYSWWKTQVKERMEAYWTRNWANRLLSYPDLSKYGERKIFPKLEPYLGNNPHTALIRLNFRGGRTSLEYEQPKHCRLCGISETEETPFHVLIDCPSLKEDRGLFLEKFLEAFAIMHQGNVPFHLESEIEPGAESCPKIPTNEEVFSALLGFAEAPPQIEKLCGEFVKLAWAKLNELHLDCGAKVSVPMFDEPQLHMVCGGKVSVPLSCEPQYQLLAVETGNAVSGVDAPCKANC